MIKPVTIRLPVGAISHFLSNCASFLRRFVVAKHITEHKNKVIVLNNIELLKIALNVLKKNNEASTISIKRCRLSKPCQQNND